MINESVASVKEGLLCSEAVCPSRDHCAHALASRPALGLFGCVHVGARLLLTCFP